MFLTTEPTFTGRRYATIRVIHACTCTETVGHTKLGSPKPATAQIDEAIATALGQIEKIASQFQADGVIGIHHNTSCENLYTYVTVMGTAIKFV